MSLSSALGPTGLPGAARAFLVTALILASLAGPAAAVAEVLNKRQIQVQTIGGVKYVPLDVFQDALNLEGDQALSGSYRLFGSAGQTADVVVEFTAGSRKISVNEKESTLAHPPIQQGNAILLPYDEFVPIFVPDSPAAHEEPAAVGQSTLQDVSHTRQTGMTVITFKLSSRPDYRFQFDGDTATLQVVFRHALKQFGQDEVELDTDEAAKITLESIPEKATLVASIHLRQEVTYDSSFDDATGQLVLRLKGPGAIEAPVAAAVETQGGDMQSYLANHPIVLDAGHGGDDTGVAGSSGKGESQLALDLALRLKPVLEKGGFKVFLTRNSDTGLAMFDRLVSINSRRPGAVLSIHLNSSFDPEAQGSQIYVLKIPAVKDTQDPNANRRGVFGPSVDEVSFSHQLARKLMGTISKGLKRRVELIEEDQTLPAARVFGPAVTLEVAYLTSTRDRPLLDKRAFLDRWAYSVYSAMYQAFLERWRADGGKGPAVEKLPDAPSALPAPEKAAPPPAKTAAATGPQVKPPESADALGGDEESEEEEAPAKPATGESRPRSGGALPRAAAVPPAVPRVGGVSPSAAPGEEDDEAAVSETIRQASSLGRPAVGRRTPASPRSSPAATGDDSEPAVTQEE